MYRGGEEQRAKADLEALINTSPVIILSGRGSDQHIARAFEMGAADHIVKPFSPTELLAELSSGAGCGR